MEIQCLYKQRGTVLYFHQATSEKKITAIPGIHYFDAHRLDALLLTGPELQLYLRAGNLPEPEEQAMPWIFPDEELSTTDGEDTSDDADSEDLKCRKAGHHHGQGAAPLNFFTPENLVRCRLCGSRPN
jgi:hypothetical protein